MTTDDATEVLTLRVAGERFGLSPATLRDMAQRGELARAHKRPCPGGEEWVVPSLTVEALARAGGVGSNGHVPPDRPGPPDAPPRRRRPLLPRGVMATVLLSLLAVAAVVAVLAATGDDAAPPPGSGDLDDARAHLGAALDEHLPAGAPVGLLGDRAEALVRDRPVVVLPDEATPPIVLLAGKVAEPSSELAARIRDQGSLILTLSGVPGGAEVWRLPDAFAPAAPSPTTPSPPSSAPPATAEPPPSTAPPPAPDPAGPPTPPADPPPAGDTVVVAAGDGFWDVAEQALAHELGRPATDAEVLPYWQALIDANQDQLPDPGNADLLYTGTVLVLPAA